ncbi:MAG: hypothetical protein R3E73_06880 [Porticoccaceae bacterium]
MIFTISTNTNHCYAGYHRAILDNYADTAILANEVKQLYQSWRSLSNHLDFEKISQKSWTPQGIARFQVNELDQLELSDNELAELEQEQHLLANAESIIQKSPGSRYMLPGGEL